VRVGEITTPNTKPSKVPSKVAIIGQHHQYFIVQRIIVNGNDTRLGAPFMVLKYRVNNIQCIEEKYVEYKDVRNENNNV